MPPKRKASSSPAGEKKPRAPTLNDRVKTLKGEDGFKALKWAKDRSSDHIVHTAQGNVKLFDTFPLSSLPKLSDEKLIEAIDFFTLARNQYLAFLSGSIAR